MIRETQKINGVQLEMLMAPTARKLESWMLAGRPASSSRRRLHMAISPAQANLWLTQANINNRPISESTLTAYACDMLAGRWHDNGDAIRFSSSGELLDGQHRLRACAAASVPLETDVIFGIDPGARGTIDIGRERTAAHIVGFAGVQNTVGSCALAGMLLIHREYGIQRMNNSECKPTKTQVTSAVLKEPRIAEVAGRAKKWGRSLAAPRIISFCYYLFAGQDEALADRFFSSLVSGADLKTGSPVYLLRERLIANSAAKAKLPLLEVIALFFKAWVGFRDGKALRVLRWRTSGPTPEPFPDISREA